MIIFILRRLLLLIITLFFLSLVSFSLLYFTPHAPLQNVSLFDAYHFYLYSLFHGDLGSSSINGQPIMQQIEMVFPATLELCFVAFICALLFGVPLGIISGVTRGNWPDITINALALFGYSIPIFWLALLLILFFSLYLGWLPVSGRYDLLYPMPQITGFALVDAWLSDSPYRNQMIISVITHLILPVVTLAVAPMTEVIRLMRLSTTTVYSQSYIKAAAIRGLSRITIIRRHLLHNALPPIIPQLALQFSTMLTLAIVTEVVFNWPGLGSWMVTAIRQQDFAAISAGIMLVGILILLANIISDIVGALATPLKHKEWYAIR